MVARYQGEHRSNRTQQHQTPENVYVRKQPRLLDDGVLEQLMNRPTPEELAGPTRRTTIPYNLNLQANANRYAGDLIRS